MMKSAQTIKYLCSFKRTMPLTVKRWKWKKVIDEIWKEKKNRADPPDWMKVVLLLWDFWIGKKSQKICGDCWVINIRFIANHWSATSRQVHFHFNCFPFNPTECSPNFTNSIVQFKECACRLGSLFHSIHL